MKLAAAFAVLVVALVAAVGPATASRRDAASTTTVTVYLVRGEQLAPVRRAGSQTPVRTSVAALLAGPTASERARGVRTAIPGRVRLLGVDLDGSVATVDLSRRFLSRPDTRVASIAQLVYTVTAVRGVDAVRVRIAGRPAGRLPGADLDLARALDRAALRPLRFEPREPPEVGPGARSVVVEEIQGELVRLGYLPRGAVDGVYGRQTQHAILAFQGWNRLRRDGRPNRSLREALAQAAPPRPRRGWSRHVEVSLGRQVALFVDRGRVVRVVHVSTGARGFETPLGSFRVFRKELRSWSYPYRVWLPYASYFTGGIAFHESPDVPAYAASHGCVRVPSHEARWVYAFARLGTRVDVVA